MMVSSAEAGPQMDPSGKALICKKEINLFYEGLSNEMFVMYRH